MRILSISQNYYVAGGMDRVMFDQARILSARRHEVVPFTAADPADEPSRWTAHFPAAARTDRTPASELPATLWRRTAARALEGLLGAEGFDVIHLHSWYKRLSPAILPVLRQSGLPVVQTMHEYRSVCSRSTMYRAGAICRDCAGARRWPAVRHRCNGSVMKSIASVVEMELADRAGYLDIVQRFLAVSDFQRDLLVSMGLPATKTHTLPNSVALLPPATGAAPVRRTILFVGRLESYKGTGLFVELARLRPHLAFAMAGSGSQQAAIDVVRPSNLVLLGQLDQATLRATVRDAACVVIPSLWPEAFGLTALEAMAAGTAVIASRTGGLPEIIRDGVDGLLVEAGDLAGFATALDAIVDDPARADEMGAKGRRRAQEDFSEDLLHDRLTGVYREVIAGGSQP